MEINLMKLGENAVQSSTTSKKMRLSENASSMVFQLFTKNIYSNPIGTVVREITSNCFDSHVEAGVNSPVLIKKGFDNQTNSHFISFIDYGVGMSPDRVENIYGVYFESTKRADNTQIGGFGIGGKTPLAYKRPTGHGAGEYDNSFYVITVHNGIKYYDCVVEGQDSPEISLLHQEETTEHNGTEVRIPVLERDLNTFSKEMVRQLYYFENIIFEGFDGTHYDNTLSNQYQIVRGKTFPYRGTEYASSMHVCLGRVAYPIDYNVLGLNSSDYYIPVALKLEVGEINVTASREQLDYSEQTIKVLKKKLEETKNEIKNLLVKQYENIVTLKDYFVVKNEFGKLKFPNGSVLQVSSLIKQTDIDYSNFKYSFMKMPNDKQLFHFFFDTKKYGKKTKSRYNNSYFEGGYDSLLRNTNLLYIEGEFVRKIAKQSYLKDTYTSYYIINRRNLCASFIRHEIADIFNVHVDKLVDDNGKPVQFVQSLIEMQEEYWQIVAENTENYDTLEVPVEYTVRKKRNVMSEDVRKTLITAKIFGSWGKSKVKLDSLFNLNVPIFYGVQEDEDKLQTAYNMYELLFNTDYLITRYNEYKHFFENNNNVKTDKGVMFIMLAKNNAKYMEFCKNAMHVDKFYNKMLYRKKDMVEKYFQTYNLVERYDTLTDLYKNESFDKIHANWGKKIKDVKKYINNLPSRNSNIGNSRHELSKFFNLNNLQLTDEQKKYRRLIEDLHEFQKRNSNVLGYISNYHYKGSLDSTLIDILSKIMVFK
jgi:hypothetical protein